MSKKTNDAESQGDQIFESQNSANAADTTPIIRAIEEHAAALNVSAPVFAAVRQYKGWAAGKKVEKSEFEKAVNGFLNAPVGGC
jgi:hypothetical protein